MYDFPVSIERQIELRGLDLGQRDEEGLRAVIGIALRIALSPAFAHVGQIILGDGVALVIEA